MTRVGNFDETAFLSGDPHLLYLSGRVTTRVEFISTTSCEYDPFEKERFHLAAHEWLSIQKCLADWRGIAQAGAPELSHSSFARTYFRDVKRSGGEVQHRRCSRIESDDEVDKMFEAVQKDLTAGIWTKEIFVLFPAIARSVFFLTEDGRPDLGPLDTQLGDVIAILGEGVVPYVLRQSSVAGQENRHSLVGECYVHGIMDGEALGFKKSTDLESIVL